MGNAASDPDNWTFYFDDIVITPPMTGGGPGRAQIDLPVTFQESSVDYTLTDFGDAATPMSTLIVDPEDETNFVAQTVKPLGAPLFAGTTIGTAAGFANPIPFATGATTIGVRVYSPDAGIPVRLKADDRVGEGAISVETEAVTTVANQWQTLVFDFSNPVAGTPELDFNVSYRLLSIFFNFGTDGDTAGEKVYLWDDVEFGVEVDTTAPTLPDVSVGSSNTNPAFAVAGDTITLDFIADEPITTPIVIIGGLAADDVSGAGTNWTATRVLGAGEPDGVVGFSIEFADLIGNPGADVSATTDGSSVTLDGTAPTVSIVAPASFSDLTQIPVTIQFSEDVSGFGIDDVTVTNGAADIPVEVNASTYTVGIAPTGSGDVTIGVRADAAVDAAGNSSSAATDVSITSDLAAPVLDVVSIASDNATNSAFARAGDTITLSIVAPDDILAPTVTFGGQAADAVNGTGTTWTATRVVQAGDADGVQAFLINFTYATGTEGPLTALTNDMTSVTIDQTAPTLIIEDVPGTLTNSDPFTVTFRFSEDVTGFEDGDIGLTNATAGALSTSDDTVFTSLITPDGLGDVTVSIAAAAATDFAGNESAAASETAFLPAYSLIWSDDFSGSALNTANWTARTLADCPTPCDEGQQFYISQQVTVDGGLLSIEARQSGPSFASGFIDTLGKLELRYGRVEIDAIMPATVGVAPTFALLPVGDSYGPWPQSGEIVIADAPNLGGGNVTVEQTLNYGLPQPEDTTTTGSADPASAPDSNTITYAVEWEAGEIRWFVDGVHVTTQTQDNWYTYFEDSDGVFQTSTAAEPFDQDFYLAIGVTVTDEAGAGSTFPQVLQIDEVRVFECANAIDPAAGTGCSTGTGVTPIDAPDMPYTESIAAYADGPATIDFIDPENVGSPVSAALAASTFNTSATITANANASDGGNVVWNVDASAAGGNAGVILAAMDEGAASGYFDLAGGDAAGELLFRLRVNSIDMGTTIEVGLDSPTGNGRSALSVTGDGVWRQYSVKLADLVADATDNAAVLNLGNLDNLFVLDVIGGSANLDIDDITAKVACRDDGGCEATARLPSVEVIFGPEDFESVDINGSVIGDGWVFFNNVFSNGAPLFNYNGAAPNGPQISAIAAGEGGPDEGAQQLSIYSDYECCSGGNGHNDPNGLVEVNVFREPRTTSSPITADDVGDTWTFSFSAKRGNLEGSSEAFVFFKVLDPMSGFSLTEFVTADMTTASTDWARYSIDLTIGPWEGQILQFGFLTNASNFEGSGVFYDNLEVVNVTRE